MQSSIPGLGRSLMPWGNYACGPQLLKPVLRNKKSHSMSIELVMPSNCLILCCPLLLLPSIFPSIRVFSNESALHIRWPKYWSFSFRSVLPMNIQGWFPVGSTSLISLVFKGLSRVFSSTTLCLFFSFIFVSWRLITSQYCSGFCHTLTWISHGVICIPHPDPPSYLPLHPIPLGLPSAPGPSTCLMHPTWAGDLFHYR